RISEERTAGSAPRPARKPPSGAFAAACQQLLGGEEPIELAALVEGPQIGEAAARALADEDLRHRPLPRRLAQPHARLGIAGDVDLLVRDALGIEEILGGEAVRADAGGVDADGGHGSPMCTNC